MVSNVLKEEYEALNSSSSIESVLSHNACGSIILLIGPEVQICKLIDEEGHGPSRGRMRIAANVDRVAELFEDIKTPN